MPPPRTHQHRYFGVLAPNSPLRGGLPMGSADRQNLRGVPALVPDVRWPDEQTVEGVAVELDLDLDGVFFDAEPATRARSLGFAWVRSLFQGAVVWLVRLNGLSAASKSVRPFRRGLTDSDLMGFALLRIVVAYIHTRAQ